MKILLFLFIILWILTTAYMVINSKIKSDYELYIKYCDPCAPSTWECSQKNHPYHTDEQCDNLRNPW